MLNFNNGTIIFQFMSLLMPLIIIFFIVTVIVVLSNISKGLKTVQYQNKEIFQQLSEMKNKQKQ